MDWLDDRAALDRSRVASMAIAEGWRGHAVQHLFARRFAAAEGDTGALADIAERLLSHERWVARLLAPLIASLVADPAFEPPLRIQRDQLRTGAILFDSADVTITATVLSADALATTPPGATFVVPGRLSVVRYVRGGGARQRRWRAGPVDDAFVAGAAPRAVPLADRRLRDGMVVRCDGRVDGQRIEDAQSDVVTLTASIRPGEGPLMREYDAATGALVRTASLDEDASRTQMLLTLLRLQGRSDAGAAFGAATGATGFHLRWAAMREWLALDARAALPRLRAMAAADPHPEVVDAARATLRMVEHHLEASCPA